MKENHENTTDKLYELVNDTHVLQSEQERIHDEVDRRVLDTTEVIGVTTTELAKRISVL